MAQENIYEELKERIADDPVTLACVEAWESPEQGVAYSPD